MIAFLAVGSGTLGLIVVLLLVLCCGGMYFGMQRMGKPDRPNRQDK